MGDKVRLLLRFGRSLIAAAPLWTLSYLLLNALTQLAIPMTLPIALGRITDAISNANVPPPPGAAAAAPTPISGWFFFWLGLTVLAIPLGIFFRVVQAKMDGKMENYVRATLFDKVLHQSPEFFREHDPGKLMNILTMTATEAQRAIRGLTVDPILQIGGAVLALFLIAQQLSRIQGAPVGLIVAGMAGFAIITGWLTQVKSNKTIMGSQSDVQEQMFALSGLADAVVKSPEEIQAMDAEPVFYQKYVAGLEQMLKLRSQQSMTLEAVNSAINLPTMVVMASLFGYVVWSVSGGHSSGLLPGAIVVIAGLTPQLMQPFKTISTLGIIASQSWPAVQVVTEVLDAPCRIQDTAGARVAEKIAPTLAVRDLEFTYAGTPRKVFNQLSFNAPTEKITALVAKSGQGKTTFFRILLRFYNQDAGTIELGGMPLDSLTIADVRRHVVLMSQFPAFFHDTVRENFRFARPDVSDDEIKQRAQETGVWPILEKAFGPNPLDAPFAGGAALSGGEKKLFALTRCLLRDPAFLLLDEPTTGMDNQEISTLIPLMKKACEGKTVIVVEHTLPFVVQFCDHVLVLDNGRIVGQGAPQELLKQNGLFQMLYELGMGEQMQAAAQPPHPPAGPMAGRAARAMPA